MKHWLFFLSDWLEKTSHAYHFTNIKRCIIYITYHITVTTNITCSPTKPTIHQKKKRTPFKKKTKKNRNFISNTFTWSSMIQTLTQTPDRVCNSLQSVKQIPSPFYSLSPHTTTLKSKKKKTWISSNPSLIIILMKKTNKKTIPDHRQLVYTSHYFLHRVWK